MTQEDIAVSRPPTLKTIAYMTGYSVTAVSRALKDAPDISEQTKERVRLVAKQIGYRPSRAGVRLRTGKTQVISLILDTDEEIMGLTSQMINGISKRFNGTNYHLVVTPYSREEDGMVPVRYVVETGSADGVILSRTEPNDPRVKYLIDNNMPFVTHGRTALGDAHSWVDYDNDRFAYEATIEAARLGCKNIGLIAPTGNLTYASHLQQGFNRGLTETGMALIPVGDITIDDSLDDIENAVHALMQQAVRPDALICAAGSAAMAAIAGIESANFKPGKDVQIISKQSTKILTRFRPDIIVFNESVFRAGEQIADIMLKMVTDKNARPLNYLDYEALE